MLGSILGDTNLTVTNRGDDTRNILKIVAESDTNGNLTFDILATNSTGYAARLTQDNLTGTPIIIDTLPPALTLNGFTIMIQSHHMQLGNSRPYTPSSEMHESYLAMLTVPYVEDTMPHFQYATKLPRCSSDRIGYT